MKKSNSNPISPLLVIFVVLCGTTSLYALPAGMISYFTYPCPPGWVNYLPAQGREQSTTI